MQPMGSMTCLNRGCRGSFARSTDENLDPERPGENQKTILVGDEKVVGRTNLDEDSSSGDWKESFEEMGPGLPILKDPLPTGVVCCLTRLSNFYFLSNFTQFLGRYSSVSRRSHFTFLDSLKLFLWLALRG